MTLLNIRLQEGSPAEIEDGVIQYGETIKNLIAANIFLGDLLYKNFGVTRYGRVAFYDYDEIEYLTDCEIREVPAPRNKDDEMASEPWYRIGPKDIFPETYKKFCLAMIKFAICYSSIMLIYFNLKCGNPIKIVYSQAKFLTSLSMISPYGLEIFPRTTIDDSKYR